MSTGECSSGEACPLVDTEAETKYRVREGHNILTIIL